MQSSRNKFTTILFVFVLCSAAALLLASVSEFLSERKAFAQKNYRNRQLLVSSRILSYDGYFMILEKDGSIKKATWQSPILVPDEKASKANDDEIAELCKIRILPKLTDKEGKIYTFDEVSIDYSTYLQDHEKAGFAKLSYKLFYEIMPNTPPEAFGKAPPYGFIFPISGYGLWDAIYGLLALKPGANAILGISWYDQKETPGLGAEISEAWWQKQFYNKDIFQKNAEGVTDFSKSPIGITVVKPGMVKSLSLEKQESAVDGVTGATITSNGVQNALKDTLNPYRNLLMNLHSKYGKST